MSLSARPLARSFLTLACLSAILAALVDATGGGVLSWGGARLAVRSPWPAAALATGAAFVAMGLGGIGGATAWATSLELWLARRGEVLAAALSVTTLAVGILFGTCVAGGSDSSGYVSQASRWVEGRLHVETALAAHARWPEAIHTLAPLGYRAAPSGTSLVPSYPPGLPLMMAAAQVVAGRAAMFWVVPFFGAAGAWWSWRLGRLLGGSAAGLLGATLVVTSPVFLFQLVQPMSDVPAAVLWLGTFALLATGGTRGAVVAGAAAGLALVIRPNLVLLVPVLAAWRAARPSGEPVTQPPRSGSQATDAGRVRVRAAALFVLAALPGVLGVALLNAGLYGSPLASGYGAAGELFSFVNIRANLPRYAGWLLASHPVHLACVAVATIASLFVRPRSRSDRGRRSALIGAIGMLVAVLASYAMYAPFDDWTYVRFLLPALPPLLVASAAIVMAAMARLSPATRAVVMLALAVAMAGVGIHGARSRGAFVLREREARYAVLGDYLSRSQRSCAAIAAQHSGSASYYARCEVVRWDLLDPAWLDRVLADLNSAGYTPILALDVTEEPAFRRRFSGHSAFAALDWPPRAQTAPPLRSRVDDPADRAPFAAGQPVRTIELAGTTDRR